MSAGAGWGSRGEGIDEGRAPSGVTKPCPECGATMPVDTRVVTWCPDCDWNFDPGGSTKSKAPGDATQRGVGRAGAPARDPAAPRPEGDVDHGARRRRLDAGPVCLVGGLAMAVLGRHSPLLIGLGVIVAPAGLGAWPRAPRLDDRAVVIEAGRAPGLWELVREVAVAVGRPRRPQPGAVGRDRRRAGTPDGGRRPAGPGSSRRHERPLPRAGARTGPTGRASRTL